MCGPRKDCYPETGKTRKRVRLWRGKRLAVVDGGVRRDGEVAVVGMLFRERAGNGCATVAVEVHLG